MNISNSQRIKVLVRDLIRNPDLIRKYFKYSLFQKRLPIDLGLPWWSYKGIQFVDSIAKGRRIFEYGTGGSTVRYANLATEIVAVEDDKKWSEIVKSKVAKLNLNNVKIRFSAFDFHNPVGFENSEYLKMVDDGNFDIIIIDGQDHTFRERLKCFRYVEPRMKAGQYIVVDDFWRYHELIQSNNAKEVKIFESVGPCRLGVTSTAVFLY